MAPTFLGGAAVLLGVAAASLYIIGTVLQWRQLSAALQSSTHYAIVGIALVAICLHALSWYGHTFTELGVNLSSTAMFALTTLVMGSFVLVASFFMPVRNLMIFVFPLSALALVSTLFVPPAANPRTQFDGELITHILLSVVAYSLLMMAACQSILLAVQDRQLKHKQLTGVTRILPSIEMMEYLLFTMLWLGLALLTAAIGSGFLFLDNMFAQRVSHHTVITGLSWVIYAVLLAGHYFFGWRGTQAVRWTLIAFTLLVIGYFGTKFVVEVLLA